MTLPADAPLATVASLDPRAASFCAWPQDRAVFAPGGVGILMYHQVRATPAVTRWPDLYVEPAALAAQIDGLLSDGLPCLGFDDALPAIRAGANGFCLTFDDGLISVYDHAMSVLAERKVRAMLFVVAGLVGGSNAWDHAAGEGPYALMNQSQIREWLDTGHDIGAHTLTHPHLPQIPRDQARAEIFESKARLEDQFGVPVRHFCYPYGDSDEHVRALVEEAGYVSAPLAAGGLNPRDVDAFSLRRIWAGNPDPLPAGAASATS